MFFRVSVSVAWFGSLFTLLVPQYFVLLRIFYALSFSLFWVFRLYMRFASLRSSRRVVSL
jgi:hypothetical protein